MKRKWMKAVAWGVAALGLGAAFLLLTAASYVNSLDVAKLGEPLTRPTVVLDRNGEELYRFAIHRPEAVPIDRMPQHLLDAVVAVEDRRFYEHSGVDFASIARALYVDAREGAFVEGASTITQQLAKNAFLSPDKSIERKLKEAAYAWKIEMTYDKKQVLERYLNSIYFGEGAWGVQSASRTYFGKDVSELTLPEAALLAGLPKAPSRYSPENDPEAAKARRDLVLGLMKEQGLIAEATYAEAVEQPVTLAANGERGAAPGRYGAYLDAVIEEAEAKYGLTEKEIMSGGWQIETELDRKMQDAVSDVFADPAMFPASENGQTVQSGAVFLDQSTGAVRAMVGSREDDAYRSFNRATQLKRQPGSAFKPIAVYAPALEMGFEPDAKLYDGPLDIDGYSPRNWDGGYRGVVTLREAIRQSWNVPAVWLLDQIGVERGLAFAEKVGIPLPASDRNLSIALGGLSEGVAPMQMAQAFAAFANRGLMHEAHTIREIRAADGDIFGRYDAEPKRVLDEHAAYTMTLLLQHAVEDGTGKRGAVPGRPTAGKTGTTQLPDTSEFANIDGGAKDLWFTGYTPELTGSVWIGYDRTDASHYMKTSSAAAAAVFREAMARALEGVPAGAFAPPPGYRADADRDEERKDDDGKGKGRKAKDRKGRDEAKDVVRGGWDVDGAGGGTNGEFGSDGEDDDGWRDGDDGQDEDDGEDDKRKGRGRGAEKGRDRDG